MKTTLRQQLEAFDNGSTMDSDGQINSGIFNFYDWFCSDKALKNKSNKLFKQVKTFIKHHPEINLDTHYVFFKNNCPMLGSTYDDFRICDIEEGNVQYTVTPSRVIRKSGRETIKMSEMWGRSNNFKQPLKEANTFTQLFKD
jgi:hypothetical protein